MNYRNAIASDFPEMQRLCVESFDPESASQRRKKMLCAPFVLIAQTGNHIVGFGMLQDGQADLLYVNHNYEQQGIAAELISKLEYIARYNTTPRPQTDNTVRPFLIP